MTLAAVALAAGTVFAATSASHAALTHLYTFNDGTANDSVGGANGTLIVGTDTTNPLTTGISGGMVTLDNGSPDAAAGGGQNKPSQVGTNPNATPPTVAGVNPAVAYVAIPASVVPTGATSSATFEITLTPRRQTFFTAAFSFDNVVGPPQPGSSYLINAISAPQRPGPGPADNPNPDPNAINPGGSLATFKGSTGGEAVAGGGPFEDNIPAVTYTNAVVIDGAAKTLSFYVNGVLASTKPLPAGNDLSTLGLTEGGLGISPFGDSAFTGTIDQFSVYNEARSAGQILADFQAGPVVGVPEPTSLALLGLGGLGLLSRRRRTA